METPEQVLFGDAGPDLQKASHGKRFANYLIDSVIFLVLVFLIFAIIKIVNPDYTLDENGSFSGNLILDRLILILFFVLYMFLAEALFKGKTLGKLITGTCAVNEDGSPLTAKKALLRSLSRIVPFEAFSTLSSPPHPWHDRWTKTLVIDTKLSSMG